MQQRVRRSLLERIQILIHQLLMSVWLLKYRWSNQDFYKSHLLFEPKRGILSHYLNRVTWQIKHNCLRLKKNNKQCLPHYEHNIDCSLIIPIFSHTQPDNLMRIVNEEYSKQGEHRLEYIFIDQEGLKTGHEDYYEPFTELYDERLVVSMASAMREANGRWIGLLLDVESVLPGTLSSMSQCLRLDARVAMVGTTLFNHYGRAVESGRSIERDGTVYPIQSRLWKDFNFINISREVHAVSLRTVMIRKSFLENVNGIDLKYSNLFYLSEDLGMAARRIGMYVTFQAQGGVLIAKNEWHNSRCQLKKKQAQDYFFKKWMSDLSKDYLLNAPWIQRVSQAEKHLPQSNILQRNRASSRRVLYVSSIPTHPSNHGNRERARLIAQSLRAQGYQIHFVLLADISGFKEGFDAMKGIWDSFQVIPCQALNVTSTQQPAMDIWFAEYVGRLVRKLCEEYHIDMVVLTYLFHSKLFDYVPSYIYKVIDSQDKMTHRKQMLKIMKLATHSFSCEAWQEAEYLRRADFVLTMSQDEADYFNVLTKRDHSRTISYCPSPRFLKKNYSQLIHLGFVGSDNVINYRSLFKIINQLYIYRKRDSNLIIQLHVLGGVGKYFKTKKYTSLKWLNVWGYVDEVTNFYRQMDLFLAPMEFGTGANIKTIEALAYGVPILTTSCGIRGIPSEEPMHHFLNIDALVAGIVKIFSKTEELNRLAKISEQLYTAFFELNHHQFNAMLDHPKLRSGRL